MCSFFFQSSKQNLEGVPSAIFSSSLKNDSQLQNLLMFPQSETQTILARLSYRTEWNQLVMWPHGSVFLDSFRREREETRGQRVEKKKASSQHLFNMLIPPFCSIHLADLCLQNWQATLKLSELQIRSDPDVCRWLLPTIFVFKVMPLASYQSNSDVRVKIITLMNYE